MFLLEDFIYFLSFKLFTWNFFTEFGPVLDIHNSLNKRFQSCPIKNLEETLACSH